LALQHSECDVRTAVGSTLELVALSNPKNAVPIFCEVLCDQMFETYTSAREPRNRIVEILGKAGDALSVLPLIRSIIMLIKELSLQTGSYATRKRHLSDALNNLATQAIKDISEPAITPLIEALSSDETDTMLRSKSSSMPPFFGAPAVAPLNKLLESENKKVRYGPIEALNRIDDDRIIEPMVKSLRDNYQFFRITAVFYLR
jgi:hypothetical protein